MKRSSLMTVIVLVVMIPVVFFMVALVENLLNRFGVTAQIDGFTALVCGVAAVVLVLALALMWRKLNVATDLVGVFAVAAAVFFSRVGASRVMSVMTGSGANEPVDLAWAAAIPIIAFLLGWFGVAVPLRKRKMTAVSVLLLAGVAVMALDWVILYVLVPNIS